jgi:hypothetical protein
MWQLYRDIGRLEYSWIVYPQSIGKQKFPSKIVFKNIVHEVKDGSIFMVTVEKYAEIR